MALIKARWETILSIYLYGTTARYCVIQRKGSKYRVSTEQDNWEMFDDLRKAAQRATEYQALFNDANTFKYCDAVAYFERINWL
jgi:hypothetical protein